MSELLSTSRRLVSIFKSLKKDEMYLYVDKKQGLIVVPEQLLGLFGEPVHAFDLLLTPERKLARADAAEVLRRMEEQGYYLQMPPQTESYMMDVVRAREAQPIKRCNSDH